MTKKQNEKMALELIRYLQVNEMFRDVNLYLNGKRYSSSPHNGDQLKRTRYGPYYITDNVDVSEYVEYFNSETITMTFEGELYEALNYDDGSISTAINDIAYDYGLYFEQGNAWNLAFYENGKLQSILKNM